jgi:predicted ATPase
MAASLIFEDVHWADHATLDLIKYLGRRIFLLRAVLVLSFAPMKWAPTTRWRRCSATCPPRQRRA